MTRGRVSRELPVSTIVPALWPLIYHVNELLIQILKQNESSLLHTTGTKNISIDSIDLINVLQMQLMDLQ